MVADPSQQTILLQNFDDNSDKNPTQTVVELATPPWREKSFRQRWLGGLKPVLRAYVALTALVLVVNVAWYASAKARYGTSGGYGALHQGDCKVAQRINLWLHLAINVLSTVILLGSSAFLLAASAPSRKEITKAHQRRLWVNIGLLSPRNLQRISSKKVFLCLILALTSIPIHLLYNSVIFPVLSSNDYFWGVVTESFLTGAPFNLTAAQASLHMEFPTIGPINSTWQGPTYLDYISNFTAMQSTAASSYERLEKLDCLKAYSQKIVPDRRNLILVSSHQNTTNSVLACAASEVSSEGNTDTTNWICSNDPGSESKTCDATPFIRDPDSWQVFGFPIEYCLSEQTSGSCGVRFSSTIALIIIASNVIKLAIELYILFKINLDDSITSVGDAIRYFMEVDDPYTKNMCLSGRVKGTIPDPNWQQPVMYMDRRPRWAAVISRARWTLSALFLAVMLLFVIILLGMGMSFVSSKGYNTSAQGLWNIGFGKIDPEILIASDNFGTPVSLSLVANIPQLILAIIYFFYNGMLTAFFTAQEYSTFAHSAQFLRVSSPAGQQQGTWCLGMPLKWGLLFLALQILLHWFVSQSFFVVDMSVYDEGGVYDDTFASIANCGFSPLAIICTLVLTGLMLLLLLVLAVRRLPSRGPPLMANCSAAIAAACHPPRRGESVPYRRMKWGAVWTWPNGVGHCSFADVDEDSDLRSDVAVVQPGAYYI